MENRDVDFRITQLLLDILLSSDMNNIRIEKIKEVFDVYQNKALLDEIEGLKSVLEDKRRLTLEIEKAMFGNEGAENPSLCDILKSVIDMKSRISELEKGNEQLKADLKVSENNGKYWYNKANLD